LLGLARSAISPGQPNIGPSNVGKALAQLIDHEEHATRITDAAPLLIPGLLQTSDDARAIIGDEPDTETRVKLRAGRRDILTRRRPVEPSALIDTEALIRPIAPVDVMADQLRHILQLAALPNVTFRSPSPPERGHDGRGVDRDLSNRSSTEWGLDDTADVAEEQPQRPAAELRRSSTLRKDPGQQELQARP
jgi:Domain of unknown function (DUF5753)